MAITRRDTFIVFRSELGKMFAEMENHFQYFLPVFIPYSQSRQEIAQIFL